MELTDFLPGLLLDLPNVPRPMAISKIREVLQEWCRHTQVWRRDHGPQDIVAPQAAYALSYDGGGGITATVEAIVEVEINGKGIKPITADYLSKARTDWRSQTADVPRRFVPESPGQLLLFPVPKLAATGVVANLTTDPVTPATGINRVYCALSPDSAATAVDDGVFEKWLPGIQDGVRTRLKSFLKKELRDPQMFQVFESNYKRTKGECRAKTLGSQGSADTEAAARFPGGV